MRSHTGWVAWNRPEPGRAAPTPLDRIAAAERLAGWTRLTVDEPSRSYAAGGAPEGQEAGDGAAREEAVAGSEGAGPSTKAPRPKKPGARLPDLDFYFPEGELDFRLNALIKNAFYEGQFRYNFPAGDINTFLRYRYYRTGAVYQISVFDALEFEAIEKLSNDFQRVRGGLFLIEWPRSYHQRTFFVAEVDRITSNKEEFRFSNNRTNTFVRLSHQIGTPDDERSNAIVGEPRASLRPFFTAHQKIGPHGFGWTGAATWGFDFVGGDFNYVKIEFEGLKRFDLTPNVFLISRVHGGTFLHREEARPDPELDPVERYAIPRTEFFRLDGRDNLKGLREALRGTEEIHSTAELFFPWFLDRSYRALGLDWRDWYWVLYAGYGGIGFDRSELTSSAAYVADLGIGFEASFTLDRYQFFLSALVAHAFGSDDDGIETVLSIKSRH